MHIPCNDEHIRATIRRIPGAAGSHQTSAHRIRRQLSVHRSPTTMPGDPAIHDQLERGTP